LKIGLILPDICSKLEFPNQKPSIRYPNWFSEYCLNYYEEHLSGKDCYALRCSIIHEGQSVIEEQNASEIINSVSFTPKGSHLISMGGINVESKEDGKNIVLLSVFQFSKDMIESVKKWMMKVENDEAIQNRMKMLLEIKENHSLYGGAISIS